ncbi:MAG: sigma-70 family RNA polymerase sigma factor [Bacteroidota bacterium]
MTDNEIIERLRSGDRTEYHWTILLQRHRLRIWAIVHKYIRSKDARQDVVQNTITGLVEYINSDKEIIHFPALLYRICLNKVYDQVENEAQKQEISRNLKKSWPSIVQNEGFSRLYNREVEDKEARIRLAMRKLSAAQRQSIDLFYRRRLSYREIAEELNLSIPKVRSALQNGKLKLKRLLEKSGSAGPGTETI